MKPPPEERVQRPWRRWLRRGLAAACLFYIGWFFYSQRQQLDLALDLDPLILLGVVSATLLSDLLNTYRFRLFTEKCSGRTVPFFAFFKLLLLGRFLNTMAAQSGNVYRAVTLKRQHGIRYTLYLSALLSMAWLGISQDLLTGSAIVAAWGEALADEHRQLSAMLLAGATAVMAAPPLAVGVLSRIELQHPRLQQLLARSRSALAPMTAGARDPIFLLKVVVTGALLFVLTQLILWLLFLAVGLRPDFIGLSVFVILLRLSGVVTLTPGNIGLREMAFGFLADRLGVGMAEGLMVSALLRIVGTSVLMVTSILLGGPELLRERSRQRE